LDSREAADERAGAKRRDVVTLLHDDEDRDRLLDELEAQRRLLDLAHDAIIVRDPVASAVIYWNREAQEIYGFTAAEAHGQIRTTW
jgi:PAS domain-containing protein